MTFDLCEQALWDRPRKSAVSMTLSLNLDVVLGSQSVDLVFYSHQNTHFLILLFTQLVQHTIEIYV